MYMGRTYEGCLRAFADALVCFCKCLELREAAFGPVHQEVAHALSSVALVHKALGDSRKAIEFHMRAKVRPLCIFRSFFRSFCLTNCSLPCPQVMNETLQGPQSSDVATNLNNLGLAHWSLGEYDAAIHCYRRCEEIRLATLG